MIEDYAAAERLAIKCESGIPEAEAIEQMKQELVDYLEYCLESLLNDPRSREERRAYIDRQEWLKGKKFADELRERVKREWEARKK